MQMSEIINKLSVIQTRLRADLPTSLRPFLSDCSLTGKRGCLVIGPRGIGKSTLLLNHAEEEKILYLSLDNPLVAAVPLIELAEAAFGEGFEGLACDEVHYAKDWGQHLKAIYDSFPKKTVWISDSSSLVLRKSSGDLSRRFPRLDIPFLSLREYLYLKHNVALGPFDPFTAPASAFSDALKTANIMKAFKDYKKEGFRPIFLEGDYISKIIGIIEKSIFFDVPFFVPQLHENHLRLMNAIMGYLATSPIPTVNVDALATDWSVGKEKLYQLLDVMEHIGLINIVRHAKDVRVSGKGAKIFFADPSMYEALAGESGNVREAFVVTMFRQSGKVIHACKDERLGDFSVGKITLEVGGRNKSAKGADFVLRDDVDLPSKKVIPLWSLGMIY
jgi:uncharacterized protein